jgi:Mycothiol maleylpyruvate isomerase N-terminal domain
VPRMRGRLRSSSGATRITPEKWLAVRAALTDVRDRFEALVADADPRARANAQWTVMDTAAHVTAIAWLYTAMVVSDDTPLPIPGLREVILTTTVDNIHGGLNVQVLRGYTEREPGAVLTRLHSCIEEILRLTAGEDPSRTVGWLGGSRLPLAGIMAHLTNELLVHGRDIARSVNAPWQIPEEYAAFFFELFLIEIIRNGLGTLLDDDRPARRGRIAVEFRSAYTIPVTIVLDTGQVSIEEPSRDNDVRVYFKPATISLVLFHYITRSRAAITGSLRVWGRRPWLLVPFLRKVRLP